MITSTDRDLMRTPFRRGGRVVGEGIDCLGVVLHKLRERGLPALDPWGEVERQWQRGRLAPDDLMPAGWHLVHDQPQDGDVVFFGPRRLGVGFVEAGFVWTAHEGAGVVRTPLHQCRPVQVWRFRA